MNRHQRKPPPPITRHPAWCCAIQQLDESIEQNSEHSNAETIRRIRMAYFADVNALKKSDPFILPKR